MSVTSKLPHILTRIELLRGSDSDGVFTSVLSEVEGQLKDQNRELRKWRHDFQTLVEVAKRLNSQALDPRRVASFVNRLAMGQFGVANTFFLRQGDFRDGVLQCRDHEDFDLRFHYESPFIIWVLGLHFPIVVNEHERELEKFGLLQALARYEIEVITPLIRSERDRRVLEGLLFLGKRITGLAFDDSDLQFLALVSDLVAIALHNASLFYASTHDALTQIYGRGHFDLTIDQEIQRARRYSDEGRRVSLAMVDVDHFKKFNDKYTHPVGDEVLRQVARTLSDTVRKIDVVARYGGEEFAIIFPEIRREEATVAAERARQAIESLELRVADVSSPLKVSVSMGVATFPEDAGDRQALINCADRALYRAKESGRNRVVPANPV